MPLYKANKEKFSNSGFEEYTQNSLKDSIFNHHDTSGGTLGDYSAVGSTLPIPIGNSITATLNDALIAGGADVKVYDWRDCKVLYIQAQDSASFNLLRLDSSGLVNSRIDRPYIDLSYCGRKATNIEQLTTTGTTTTTLPVKHGLPTNLYLGGGSSMTFSTGSYFDNSGVSSNFSYDIISIPDANSIEFNIAKATFDADIASILNSAEACNMYYTYPILWYAGGNDYSNVEYSITWSFDTEAPTFLESIYSIGY